MPSAYIIKGSSSCHAKTGLLVKGIDSPLKGTQKLCTVMKTGRNFPAKGLSMTIFNKLALDIMHHIFTPQQTRSSQNASSWVGWFYFKFAFSTPWSPSGSAISYVFFHEGKFTFISSGRTAALEAGNVYGELSAGAVRNKTENQNQTVSTEQSKGITMYFNQNNNNKKKKSGLSWVNVLLL